MTSNIEFTYNGKVYQAAHGSERYGCTGCAFADTSCIGIADLAQEQTGKSCFCSETLIWQEKPADSIESSQQAEMTCDKQEPSVLTWTEQEIREAYAGWSGTLEDFIKILKKNKDPEYQKYLELKAKFGE